MKKLIALLACTIYMGTACAQDGSDSAAYELQRKKINGMLAARSEKFGKYDASLSKHTGIFGLQTKKDIRRSNEILMDIVKTDNEIYRQLKVLLDYRAFQQTQVQEKAKETENTALGFMYTIKRLQDQVEKQKAESVKQEEKLKQARKNFYVTFALLGLASIYMVYLVFKRSKNSQPG